MSTKDTKKKGASTAAVEDSPAQEESTALVATEPQELAVGSFDNMEADSAKYSDDFSKEDFAIPFLVVLQSNSPQTQKGGSDYVEGAEASNLFLTSSKETFEGLKAGVRVVPVQYEKKFIAWKLREEGGGFVKSYNVSEGLALLEKCTQDEKGRQILPRVKEGDKLTQLVETMSYLVLVVTDEGSKAAIFALTSTQLKKGRNWNTAIEELRVEGKNGKFRPPMFAMCYTVTTVSEKNEKGSWYGVKIVPHKLVTTMGKEGQELYAGALSLRDKINTGEINTDAAPNPEGAGSNTPF